MRIISLVVLAAVSTVPTHADVFLSPEVWTVTPDFEKNDEARSSLSGGACATGTNHCFAVNDEKKYAQFFDILGRNISPAELIRLLPDEVDGVEMDEIDAEGVTFVPATTVGGISYFYVVGSHGVSRTGVFQPSRFVLLRFPVDTNIGRPNFAFGDSGPAPEIEMTTFLRETIRNTTELATYAEQRLDRNGVTIEGIAVTGEDALFGLRSPCVAANALVMRVPINDLFQESIPVATVSDVELGDNSGIRDLATVEGGTLILSGRSDDARGDQQFTCGEPRTPTAPLTSVWFWSGNDNEGAKLLGALPGVSTSESAETLLVLEETEIAYRVLVLFDGVANGAPLEFTIDK